MPPSAAPEWLRTGWIFESSATSAPASCASMAARIPAQPAPTMRTSCLASTTQEATQCLSAGPLLQQAGRAAAPAALPPKFRTLLGPCLRLPAVPGSGAVVMRALVVEREATHAQRSCRIARRVELPGHAVARRDVRDRRAAFGPEW